MIPDPVSGLGTPPLSRPRGRWQRAWSRLGGRLPMPITHVAPVTQEEPPSVVSRRRWAVAATSVAGAGLLGVSLSTRPGSVRFYGSTLGVAAVWTLGGLLSGPLHLGWIEGRDRRLRRPLVTPVATGVTAFGFFYGCALVARRIPFLDAAIRHVLRFAEQGDLPLVLLTTYANGIGEEVFFRGALYAALPDRHAVVASTGVYTVATVTTRNPSLVLAAAVTGGLFGLQRRATGGLQAPLLTHLTWSTLMVRYLPPLFRTPAEDRGPGRRRGHPEA
jgi:membrane protease YdiL (CAAX protease family)